MVTLLFVYFLGMVLSSLLMSVLYFFSAVSKMWTVSVPFVWPGALLVLLCLPVLYLRRLRLT